MKVEVTKELLVAIQGCVQAKRDNNGKLKYSEEYKQNNQVGEILREAVERGAQQVDIVEGWLERVREECE